MTDDLFGRNNSNSDIFIVETEQGPDSDDNMCAMIGDATMTHLQSLSPSERQVWEHYILTGGKNLFDFVPSNGDMDKDPHNLKVEDLDTYFANNKVAEKMKPVLEEAIEVEKERREKSEDAYDRGDTLIPYQDWAENPQQFKHYDMPTTPKNIAIYCGNVTQYFYDDFPEGHPDSKVINELLVRVNKDPDDMTDKYGEWLKKWLGEQVVQSEYTTFILELLVTRLVEGEKDPIDTIKKALECLDDNYRHKWLDGVNNKMNDDAIYQLIARKQQEWDEEFNKGLDVLPFVKSFGQLMFTKFRGHIKKSHWAFYRALKTRYASAVLVKGLNINSCRLSDLERVLKVPRPIAIDIWVNRPYSSPQELIKREVTEKAKIMKDKEGKEWTIKPARTFTKGWLTKDVVESNTSINELYELIRERARLALERRNLKLFSALSMELVERQRAGTDTFTSKEWNAAWTCYRSTKSDMLNEMQGKTNE